MGTDRDNPAGTRRSHGWAHGRQRRGRSRRPESAGTDDNLERQGRMLLVYTGDCEPFDARETIKKLREERTP